MPESCKDRGSAATHFRVIREATTGTLSVESGGRTLQLRRAGLTLHFDLEPTSYGLSLLSPAADRAWLEARVVGLGIGHSGDEGWRSSLADDSVFVLDGDELRVVGCHEARITSLQDFSRLRRRVAVETDTEGWLPRQAGEAAPEAEAVLSHLPAWKGHWEEGLALTVGLPESAFDLLVEKCAKGLVDRLYVHGVAGALSTAMDFETPRDLILASGGSAWLDVDAVSISCALD